MNIDTLKQSSRSTFRMLDFSDRFVDVLIHRLDAGALVAKYAIPLINEHEASHQTFWFNTAWSYAIADGLVADHERSEYKLELQGNLTVNDVIDRAQELNGTTVCVRGRLVLDFEHEALIHQPKSEYRECLPPSNTTGHHSLFGSEIWLNLSTLGYSRTELAPRIGVWVSVYGTLHAAIPPDMRKCWQSRLRNWWKYGSAEPDVGLGHFGGFPVTIDVLEIIDLQPVVANESESVANPLIATEMKVIRGSNVTNRIIQPRESSKNYDHTVTRSMLLNDSKLVNVKSTKNWFEKVENPGVGTLWFVIALLLLIIVGKTI